MMMLIDVFSLDCFEKIHYRASNLLPDFLLYLLLDGAFVDGIHQIFPEERKRILFDSLPSCTPRTRDFSPFLIEFDPLDRRIRALFDRCSGWPMISAIETTESLSALANRSAAWCIVDADGSRFNFRLADTRRIPAISRILTAEQMASFSGPASNWSFIGREGHWESVVLSERSPLPAHSIFDPRLDTSQFNALIEDGRADEVLAVMGCRGELPASSRSRIWKSIVAALEMAARNNLADMDTIDWSIWCANNHLDHFDAKLQIRLQEWLTKCRLTEHHGEEMFHSSNPERGHDF